MHSLDLLRLGSPESFQHLCFRLVKKEWPTALALNYASWDGGSDVMVIGPDRGGDVVWQCKFTRSLGATTRRSILRSLESLGTHYPRSTARNTRGQSKLSKWILCTPVDPTRVFVDWLRRELSSRHVEFEIWGRSELLRRLEMNPDLVQCFFFAEYATLRRAFRTESLELVQLALDRGCAWSQPDRQVLFFVPSQPSESPDLVLDISLRNLGEVETALTGLVAEVTECHPLLHGLPRPGLLQPRVVYRVSLRHGAPGMFERSFRRYLQVPPGRMERLKVRLTETGSSWAGAVRIHLRYGRERELALPWMQLST